ncbi:putative quinol monooxygenase [Thalassospiraceae bacterium LMO-JJ14]|nr:putative quinol monooxygenase [Thalassospiraceae bacterium LMO-JJ14]
MSKFAIFVTVKVKDGMVDDFLAHALANATAAVRDEPNCHMFRVMRNQADPQTVHFYEVYTEAGSLDYHRETPHYKAYDSAVADMIAEKSIVKVDLLH